jgi:hypothetical protein
MFEDNDEDYYINTQGKPLNICLQTPRGSIRRVFETLSLSSRNIRFDCPERLLLCWSPWRVVTGKLTMDYSRHLRLSQKAVAKWI